MLKRGVNYEQLHELHIDTDVQPLGLYSGSPFPRATVSRIVPERRGRKKNDTVGLNVR